MKVLAITAIPSGVDLNKNCLLSIDATFFVDGVIENTYSSMLTPPFGRKVDIDVDLEDTITYDYAQIANDFHLWLTGLGGPFIIILNQDHGWINKFLSDNDLPHIEYLEESQKIIDFSTWVQGIELADITETPGRYEFEDSLQLGESFLHYNEKRVEYKEKITGLIDENISLSNLRPFIGIAFIMGLLFGGVFAT